MSLKTSFSLSSRLNPIEVDHFTEENHYSLEMLGQISKVEDGRSLVPDETLERGAFFKVVIPRGKGPLHLTRLIITGLCDGTVNQEIFILILFDLIERVFAEALHKREFRKKWRKELKALRAVIKVLPQIRKNNYSLATMKYLISNRMNQEIDFTKFIIPPKNRDDKVLSEIRVIRHREYSPPVKKSTKIPSNSSGTKGTYQPNSISWQSVASKEMVFDKGEWKPSKIETNPNDLDEVT